MVMGKRRRRKRFSIGIASNGDQCIQFKPLGETAFKQTLFQNIGLSPTDSSNIDDELSSFLPTFYPSSLQLSCLGTYYTPNNVMCKQCRVRPKCLSELVQKSTLWKKKSSSTQKIVFEDRFFMENREQYFSLLEFFDATQKFNIKQGVSIQGEGVLEKVSRKILQSHLFTVKAKDVTKYVKEVLEVEIPFSGLIATTMCVIDQIMGKVIEEA